MTAVTALSPLLIQHFVDNSGNALVNGQLFSYAAGTSTPLATYTDSTGATANTNPVILNARGEASVWLTPNTGYKFQLQDQYSNVIWTVDQVFDSQLLTLYAGVDSGVVNAYILSGVSLPFSSLVNGIVLYWIPVNTNTSASTLNLNSSGVLNIVNPNGTTLSAGQIQASQPTEIMYYNGAWILLNGSFVSGTLIVGTSLVVKSDSATTLGTVAGTQVDISADTGTFTPIWTGFSSAPTAVATWIRQGNLACLYFPAGGASGTSNATGMQITNLPAAITPRTASETIQVPCIVEDAGVTTLAGQALVNQIGTIIFGVGKTNANTNLACFTTNFSASGTKGVTGALIWPLL